MTDHHPPAGVVEVDVTAGEDLADLADHLHARLRAPDAAAIVVRATGTVLDPTGDVRDEDPAAVAADRIRQSLRRAGLPSVIAVSGAVSGAGLATMLGFDVTVCHPHTTLTAGTPAAVLASGLPALLTRQVGPVRARAMALTDRVLDGHTAQQWGLVSEVDEQHADRAAALAAGWATSLGMTLVGRALTAAERLPADESASFDHDLRALLLG